MSTNSPMPFCSAAEAYHARKEFEEHERSKITLQHKKQFMEFKDSSLIWNFHYGQMAAMQSKKRIINAIASRQSGKTEVGVPWLYEEMRAAGPGNYMVVAPSYPILEASALPKFRRLFVDILKLGKITSKPLTFKLSADGERHFWGHEQSALNPTIVSFGHGANPASLEARTSKAAWIDEGGQPSFKRESFEAIEGRHTTTGGRILITSTPYDFNAFKQMYYDPWEAYKKAGKEHPDIDVIQWPSTANPNFPVEEFERLRGTMPDWRFRMFYCGEFSMPSGLIYDIVANNSNDPVIIPAFPIPGNWPRYVGLDFGGLNTFAIFAALDHETRTAYCYKEYYPEAQYNIANHARNIIRLAGGHIEAVFGGAASEGQWREEFGRAGLFVHEPPLKKIDVGIARAYNLMAQGRLKIMSGIDPVTHQEMTERINKEIYEYRYKTDPETGDVDPKLEIMEQNKFHAMDAMRYLSSGLGFLLAGETERVGRAGGRAYNQPREYVVSPLSVQNIPGAGVARAGRPQPAKYVPLRSEMKYLSRLRRFD